MENIHFRLGKDEDKDYLTSWLEEPGILRGFPMQTKPEIVESVNHWMSFCKIGSVLTATLDHIPVGIAVLYIQPYRKFSHQCLFAIIVDPNHRGKGVGKKLIEELIILAKKEFKIELLHLEVYEGNPAIRLYKRLGFEQYGFHPHCIKDHGEYIGKYMMQKQL